MVMSEPAPEVTSSPSPLLQSLAAFRFHLRQFLRFSEDAAARMRLSPQQHQLLLQIAGAADDASPTIAFIAQRLAIRPHSAAELANRCVEEGLVERTEDAKDRRRVILRITPYGRNVLQQLSEHHARELNELAPALVASLKRIGEFHLQK